MIKVYKIQINGIDYTIEVNGTIITIFRNISQGSILFAVLGGLSGLQVGNVYFSFDQAYELLEDGELKTELLKIETGLTNPVES